MNTLLILAKVATQTVDSLNDMTNPVLTPVSSETKMNMLDMAMKG